jgi:hypothetical protein
MYYFTDVRFLPKNNLPICCGFQTMLIRWCNMYGELANIQVLAKFSN